MRYYTVHLADSRYKADEPLTYSCDTKLASLVVVSVPLRNRLVTGFIDSEVEKPKFKVKPIKSVLSNRPLPSHSLSLAAWIKEYYRCSFGEALRLCAPSIPSISRKSEVAIELLQENMDLDSALTQEQKNAIKKIKDQKNTTVLLHGETGSGKTRVYLELASEVLSKGRSVIFLTPEIALTTQLKTAVQAKLNSPIYLLHSELTPAARKRVWFSILESSEPVVVIGPRSALFAPIQNIGLIIVDEAHEPAYKQEQTPYFHAVRVASALGQITQARVILGSATPSLTDYFLATDHHALVTMKLQAKTSQIARVKTQVIDHRDKSSFSKNRYLSNQMIDEVSRQLKQNKQSLLYYNRRGSARLILCDNCGWQFLCPNCDIPVIYHSDLGHVQCHICGFKNEAPNSCPVCANPDVIYTSIGTKTLVEIVKQLFPMARVQRYDSDNEQGERLNETYEQVYRGEIDIMVGTQLLAKGLDLPKLGLVGVIAAETSLTIPDYSAEERTFQLLYQAMGRVGRHGPGKVIIQSYNPDSSIISASAARDYDLFYKVALKERQIYKFPPFAYLLKLTCKRTTSEGARRAAENLKKTISEKSLPIEIAGPTASFYTRRHGSYYYQLVIKSKDRQTLTKIADFVPSGWIIDLDPVDLI